MIGRPLCSAITMTITAKGQILVIAPSPDMRNSLRFALEAEGYVVTVRTEASGGLPPRPSYDCIVLDHHAADADPEAARRLAIAFRPIVLLANHAGHPLSSLMFRTVLKPMLGPALAMAIRDAIGTRGNPT
jgi:CheY-like chemotaxis protein